MAITNKICRAIRTLTGRNRYTVAVLLAGGIGSRMASEDGTTKQLMNLKGKPLIAYAARAFEDCDGIDEIVVVARNEEIERVRLILEEEKIKKVSQIVKGGETRQESAKNGFDALGEGVDYVAVHDAARCMVTPDMISRVLAVAYEMKAASAATRVTDTVKIAGGDGIVRETPDRNLLWAAQTPQVFDADLYRAATYMAEKEGFRATDDNSMVEAIGHRVKLVDCGPENFKITTKADLIMAEVLLRMQEREEKKPKKKEKAGASK